MRYGVARLETSPADTAYTLMTYVIPAFKSVMFISLASTSYNELSLLTFLPLSRYTNLHLTMGDARLVLYFHRIVTVAVVVFVTCRSDGGNGPNDIHCSFIKSLRILLCTTSHIFSPQDSPNSVQ